MEAARDPDWSDGADRTSPLKGLPSFGSYYTDSGGDAQGLDLFVCGDCGQPSPFVRHYSLPTVVLLPPIFVMWRADPMMKCPRCMRRHVLARLPLTILLSNLASPLVVIWWLIVFVKTFFSRPG